MPPESTSRRLRVVRRLAVCRRQQQPPCAENESGVTKTGNPLESTADRNWSETQAQLSAVRTVMRLAQLVSPVQRVTRFWKARQLADRYLCHEQRLRKSFPGLPGRRFQKDRNNLHCGNQGAATTLHGLHSARICPACVSQSRHPGCRKLRPR